MEISIDITHVGDIGDRPETLRLNDSNKTETVNLNIGKNHYRVNADKLERALKALK